MEDKLFFLWQQDCNRLKGCGESFKEAWKKTHRHQTSQDKDELVIKGVM